MANSCPPKKVALDNFLLKLTEIAQDNPSVSGEIQSLQQSIEAGMVLRSGFVKRGGKNKYSKRKLSRKHRGGMPPKRTADVMEEASNDAVLSMSDADRSALLNAMSHIIAVGTITGGSAALMCYIVPAIEAFLVSKGLVPMLCSGSGVSGMVEWGFRIVAAPITNIETCMAIQTRYDLIVKQIIASIGIPSGFAILYERAKIKGGYLAYKNMIYKILQYCVDGIKAIFRRSPSVQEPQVSDEEIKRLVDEAIRNEFPELMEEGSMAASASARPSMAGPSMAGPSMARPSMAGPSMAGPSMAGPSMARPNSSLNYRAAEGDDKPSWFQSLGIGLFSRERSETPPPDDRGDEYGSSGHFGGSRRHRKRKTSKKRTKTSRNKKMRKHHTRRHR